MRNKNYIGQCSQNFDTLTPPSVCDLDQITQCQGSVALGVKWRQKVSG